MPRTGVNEACRERSAGGPAGDTVAVRLAGRQIPLGKARAEFEIAPAFPL